MTRSCVLTLALIVLAAVPAGSQGRVGLGPQIGFYKSQDADNASVMGGAALRLKLSQSLGIEGSINYRAEEYQGGLVTVKTWPVMLTGLIYPIPIVYGAIGTGWYNTSIDYKLPPGFMGGPGVISSETKQRVGWHFGGGVELPLGPAATLVGDIRYVFLDYGFQQVPGTNGLNSDFYVITAGLLFGL